MRAPKPEPWQGFDAQKRRRVEAVIRWMSRANTWLYRKTNGRIGGSFFEGAEVCLLTVIGRKSGLPRTVPLLHFRDGERVVVVASKGGDTKHPLWYLNLVANPDVTVQIRGDVQERRARTATPEEKAAIWPRLTAFYSGYAEYQAIADRDIPVVFLEPR